MAKIALVNAGQTTDIIGIYNGSASVTDEINGEYTISFVLYGADVGRVSANTLIRWNGDDFQLTKLKKYSDGEAVLLDVSAEHVSYGLNDIIDDTFAATGTVTEVLTALLSDTGFTAGSCLPGDLDVSYKGANKRAELISIAGEAAGEIVYDGYTISIVAHRGATAAKDIYGSGNYNPGRPEINIDLVKNTTAYSVPLITSGDLATGDNVRLKYDPYGINVDTRILKMIFNPYDDCDCQISVGDYEADILDKYIETASTADNAIQPDTDYGGTEYSSDGGISTEYGDVLSYTKFSDITIPASGWASDPAETFANYPYQNVVQVAGVTADMDAGDWLLQNDDYYTYGAKVAPGAATTADGVIFYATEALAADIMVVRLIVGG